MMVAENMTVKITVDTSKLEAALRGVAAANRAFASSFRSTGRKLDRLANTRGDRHIESIIRDCLTRRLSVEDTARRLMVASDIAYILDRRRLDHAALDATIRDGLAGWGA